MFIVYMINHKAINIPCKEKNLSIFDKYTIHRHFDILANIQLKCIGLKKRQIYTKLTIERVLNLYFKSLKN